MQLEPREIHKSFGEKEVINGYFVEICIAGMI